MGGVQETQVIDDDFIRIYVEKISNNLARMTVTAKAGDSKIQGFEKNYKLNESFKISENFSYNADFNNDKNILEITSKQNNYIEVFASVSGNKVETKVIIFRIN